ncbi:MAG: glycosyltransferase family 39 protein [archaeon]
MSGDLFPNTVSQFSLISKGEPILLIISLVLLVFMGVLTARETARQLGGIKRNYWLVFATVLAAATIFRIAAVPLTNRVYFDEDLYLNTGKNIAESLRACMCNAAFETNGCSDCILNKAPSAHPFVLSIFSLFFGIGRAHFLNSLIVPTLSILLVFLCGYLLFNSARAGVLAAVFASTIPVFLEWSMTAAAEPTVFFFSLLSLFILLLFSRTRRSAFLFALACSLSFLAQAKAEGILFVPVFALGLLILNGRKLLRKIIPILLAAALFFLLSSVSLYHVYIAGKNSNWGADTSAKFSVESFKTNLPINSRFLLFGYPGIAHPFILTISALAGLVLLLALPGRRGAAVFLLTWFLSFFFLYCSFYAGSVRYGTDVRYALAYYPALTLLAAAIGSKFSWKGLAIFSLVIIGSFAFNSLSQVTTPAEKIAEAKLARDYKTFVFGADLPRNCTIASHVTSIYNDLGIPTVQPWYLEDPSLLSKTREKRECLLFDYGFWCAVPPFKDDQCARLISRIGAEKVISDSAGTFGYYSLGT